MIKQAILIVVICFISNIGFCQKIGVKYRPTLDSTFHYLTFKEDSIAELNGIGSYWKKIMPKQREFKYTKKGDTITFTLIDKLDHDSIDIVSRRILNAHFIRKHNNQLYDIDNEAYYIDWRKSKKIKGTVFSIDGKILLHSYKKDAIPLKIKKINKELYQITILSGKEGFEKYGPIGINGVFEFKRKKYIN
jgi:hypothetical protein